jgi:SAP domain-containing ribonucleoprotein
MFLVCNFKLSTVSELRAGLLERGLSTDGLKAELINRLQARLDEEEFGLAEAPPVSTPKAGATAAPAAETTPVEAAATTPAAKEKKEKAASTPAAASPKPNNPSTTTTSESKKKVVEEKSEETAASEPTKSEEKTSEEKTEGKEDVGAANVTEQMSFEEKKKARAARFKMEVVKSPTKENKTETRKRRGEKDDDKASDKKGGKDGDRPKRQKKEEKKPESFEGVSKEELEKRLKRADRFGVANDKVDAMKAALRKIRFESK